MTYELMLFCIVPPLMLWRMAPHDVVQKRTRWLFVTLLIAYIVYNVGVHMHHVDEASRYALCQQQFPDAVWQLHPQCGAPWIGNGAQKATALWFGWLPAFLYVGLCQYGWRLVHRRTIRQMGTNFKETWLAKLCMGTSAVAAMVVSALWLLFAVFPQG